MKKLFMIGLVLTAMSMTTVFAAPKAKVDKSVLTAVEEGYDFIYEVVNNTSGTLTVATYVQSGDKRLAKAADVALEKGESYQFKYSLKTLKKLYGESAYIGCEFEPEWKWRCYGWTNNFNVENQRHIVKVTDAADPSYCMDGENIWDFIDLGLLTQNEEGYDFIYEVVNNTSGKLTVATYLKNTTNGKFVAKADNVVIEQGKTYQFKYSLDEVKTSFGKNLNIGCFFTPEAKWRCNGWEGVAKNKKHIVVCQDAADPNYCMDAENKWENIQ